MRMKTTIDEQRNQIRQRNHDIESQRNEIDAVSSIMKLSRLFLYFFFIEMLNLCLFYRTEYYVLIFITRLWSIHMALTLVTQNPKISRFSTVHALRINIWLNSEQK